jgi:hypothetical protein
VVIDRAHGPAGSHLATEDEPGFRRSSRCEAERETEIHTESILQGNWVHVWKGRIKDLDTDYIPTRAEVGVEPIAKFDRSPIAASGSAARST